MQVTFTVNWNLEASGYVQEISKYLNRTRQMPQLEGIRACHDTDLRFPSLWYCPNKKKTKWDTLPAVTW